MKQKVVEIKQTERDFSTEVVTPFLKAHNIFYFKPTPGYYARPGLPDYICCITGGRFVGLEIKTDKGVQSSYQKDVEEAIEQVDGIYIIVRPSNWPSIQRILLR